MPHVTALYAGLLIGLFVLLTIVHVIVFVGGRVRLRWTCVVVLGVLLVVASG